MVMMKRNQMPLQQDIQEMGEQMQGILVFYMLHLMLKRQLWK